MPRVSAHLLDAGDIAQGSAAVQLGRLLHLILLGKRAAAARAVERRERRGLRADRLAGGTCDVSRCLQHRVVIGKIPFCDFGNSF